MFLSTIKRHIKIKSSTINSKKVKISGLVFVFVGPFINLRVIPGSLKIIKIFKELKNQKI